MSTIIDRSSEKAPWLYSSEPMLKLPWPDPTPEMLETPAFEAIWDCIKTWDISVPGAYDGYTTAEGNHVRAILDALKQEGLLVQSEAST